MFGVLCSPKPRLSTKLWTGCPLRAKKGASVCGLNSRDEPSARYGWTFSNLLERCARWAPLVMHGLIGLSYPGRYFLQLALQDRHQHSNQEEACVHLTLHMVWSKWEVLLMRIWNHPSISNADIHQLIRAIHSLRIPFEDLQSRETLHK